MKLPATSEEIGNEVTLLFYRILNCGTCWLNSSNKLSLGEGDVDKKGFIAFEPGNPAEGEVLKS